MPETVSGTLPNPATLPHEDIRVLLRAGKNEAAIARLCAVLVTQPDDLLAKELLFDAFFQSRNWQPARVLAEELAARQPQLPRLRKNLIVTLSNMKRYEEAIAQAAPYLERHGEDLQILDVLKVGHFYSGRMDEAIRHGQRALVLRDAEACRNPPAMAVHEPSGRSGRNVISFSLWGPAPFYSYGAMSIWCLAAPSIRAGAAASMSMPPCRAPCVTFLRDNGADVRNIEDEYPSVGLFQRFLVMNDESVERFLVRDCDARLSVAEADLVKQWIDSGYAVPRRARPRAAQRIDDRLPVGRAHRLRHRHRRIDAALFRARPDRQIRARPAHARPDAVAAASAAAAWCTTNITGWRACTRSRSPTRQSHFGAGHQNAAAVLAEAERLGIPRVL